MTLDCTCNRLIEAERKAALWDGIVRCGDCATCYTRDLVDRRGEVFDTVYLCELMLNGYGEGENEVDADHFCAWGERKKGA